MTRYLLHSFAINIVLFFLRPALGPLRRDPFAHSFHLKMLCRKSIPRAVRPVPRCELDNNKDNKRGKKETQHSEGNSESENERREDNNSRPSRVLNRRSQNTSSRMNPPPFWSRNRKCKSPLPLGLPLCSSVKESKSRPFRRIATTYFAVAGFRQHGSPWKVIHRKKSARLDAELHLYHHDILGLDGWNDCTCMDMKSETRARRCSPLGYGPVKG